MQAVCSSALLFFISTWSVPAYVCGVCVYVFSVGSALLQIARSFIENNLNSRHFVDTKFIKLMASNQFNGVSNGVSFHFVNKCGPFCAYDVRLSEAPPAML